MHTSILLHTLWGLDSTRLLSAGLLVGAMLLAPGAVVFAGGLLRRRAWAMAGAALIAVGLAVGAGAVGVAGTLHTADMQALGSAAGVSDITGWSPLRHGGTVMYTRDGSRRAGRLLFADGTVTLVEAATAP